jgi:hypothetical protein
MRLASGLRCLLFVLSIALSQSVGHADYVAGLDPYGDNFLALRAGPGTSFRTIRRMGPDTILTVLRRRGAWLRVRTEDGEEGWAFGQYVAPGFPPGYDDSSEEDSGWEEERPGWSDEQPGFSEEGPITEEEPSGVEEANPGADEPSSDTPAPAATPDNWRTYTNPRFGTSIDYPAAFFRMEPPPENDDGRSFTTRDGRTRFIVFGSHNVFEKTLSELMEDDIAAAEEEERITYRRSGDDWYVLSGHRNGDVFYRKTMLSDGGAIVHTFEIAYVKALKPEFDEITVRMAKSLNAGGAASPTVGVPEDTTSAEPEAEPNFVAIPEETPAVEDAEAAAAPAIDSWRSPLKEVLFAGEQSALFLPHQASGGVFDRDARFEDGALVVDVAKGNGWGKVGLLSNDALVWLDEFHDDAEVRVTFTLDPERTSGFGLALTETGWGGIAGNDPGYPGVRFYWIRNADGASARRDLHVDPHRDADFWSDAASSEAPTAIAFVLRPGTVTIEVDGAVIAERPAAFLRDGVGLRVYAFSHVADIQGPAKMALSGISVTRHYPTLPRKPDAPAEGVAPLPTETLFSGEPTPAFEPAAVAGGDFAAFARYADGALRIDVPAGHSWGKTGLISAEPLVRLDDRARQTPLRLTLTVDPDQTATFTVALAGDKVEEMWPGHIAWFALTLMPETGDYRIAIHASAYNDRFRTVPAAWVDAYWDGTLEYDVADNLACMRMPPGPNLCAAMPTGVGGAYYATIMAHAPVADAPTSLVLRSITRGLVTPPGMTADRRWFFVDDEAFDPDQFLEELGSLLQ